VHDRPITSTACLCTIGTACLRIIGTACLRTIGTACLCTIGTYNGGCMTIVAVMVRAVEHRIETQMHHSKHTLDAVTRLFAFPWQPQHWTHKPRCKCMFSKSPCAAAHTLTWNAKALTPITGDAVQVMRGDRARGTLRADGLPSWTAMTLSTCGFSRRRCIRGIAAAYLS